MKRFVAIHRRFDHDHDLGPYGPHFMIVEDDVDVDQDLMRRDPPWTKQSHPYCYDPFTIWGAPRSTKACNGTVYTDRLDQWDRSKYERLAAKHYRGHRPFDSYQCKGHLIEAFLRDWFDEAPARHRILSPGHRLSHVAPRLHEQEGSNVSAAELAKIAFDLHEKKVLSRAELVRILQGCVNVAALDNGYADEHGLPFPDKRSKRSRHAP